MSTRSSTRGIDQG
jgi:ankyrin repeat protein